MVAFFPCNWASLYNKVVCDSVCSLISVNFSNLNINQYQSIEREEYDTRKCINLNKHTSRIYSVGNVVGLGGPGLPYAMRDLP